MTKVIEAKAVISGEDRLSGVIDKINGKLKQVGKGTKISADVDKLNKSLADAKRGLEAIDRLRERQATFATARTRYRADQEQVGKIARELAAARKAAAEYDGVRGFSRGGAIAQEIADARRKVTDLEGTLRTAQRAVKGSAGVFESQSGALKEARRTLVEAGIPVAGLAAHERALRQSVDGTTAAIQGQAKALRERERVAQAKGLRQQRRQEAIDAAAERVPRRPREAPRRERGERSLGPIAGLIGAGEAVAAYREAAAFDRRITMIGQTADAARPEIDGLAASVHDLAQQTATPVDKLAGGLEALVAQGRNLKESMAFLPAVAKTAAASGSEVDDIAKTADSVGTNFEIAGGQMQKAFDIMAAGGKAGQFELKDMARYLPSLGPAASAIGFKGEKGLSDLVAMLQVMRKGSGTAEEAVSSMNNILAKMESDKTTKNFKALGVDSEAAFKKARKEGKNLVEVFEELVNTALKGDRSRLGEIIDDMEFKRGVQALMSYRGEWQKLSQTLRDTSGGTVQRDLVQVTRDAQAGLDRLSNSWKRFTQAAARAGDAGGISAGLGATGRELEEIAQSLERINRAYTEGGFFDALKQGLGDGANRLRENRKLWLDHYDKGEDKRIAELEAAKEAHRKKLTGEGRSPAEIADAMAIRDREIERARGRKAAVKRAREAPELADGKPLRMGVDPAPADRQGMEAPAIRGETAPVYPGIPSFQQAFPLDLSGRKPGRATPLPPARPPELPTLYGRIEDVLNPQPGASPGPRAPAEPGGRTIPVEVTKLPDRAAETFRPSLDGRGAAKAMPDGADAGAGFPTAVPASRGFWGDLFRGPTTRQQQLPGFGAGSKAIPVTIENLPSEGRLDTSKVDQRAAPDQRLEATVKPDQITARVTEIPPVTGTVTETVTHQHNHTITLNTDLLNAQIRSVVAETVKSIPLASSGARPGAISMPGAAGNPGGH